MNDNLYKSLELKVDKLIKLCTQLEKENHTLQQQNSKWLEDKEILLNKNELAIKQLESMVLKLQKIESNYEF
jgi:cell division protein ZapB